MGVVMVGYIKLFMKVYTKLLKVVLGIHLKNESLCNQRDFDTKKRQLTFGLAISHGYEYILNFSATVGAFINRSSNGRNAREDINYRIEACIYQMPFCN
jgi:hypothetical protein